MRVIALGVALSFAAGCDTGQRITRLEKENEELKAEIKKNQAAADFDLQAKCSKDARAWFNENWSRDKDTVLLDFTNHYNKAQNKCFILVEYHYSLNDGRGSWTGDMALSDIYENIKYGDFAENHLIFFKPTVGTKDQMLRCEVYGKKCKTLDEFNELIRSYLNN
jgi:hypothetical protein